MLQIRKDILLINIANNRTLFFIILEYEGALFFTYKAGLEYPSSNPRFNFSKVINLLVFEKSNKTTALNNTINLHFIKLNLGFLFKRGKAGIL